MNLFQQAFEECNTCQGSKPSQTMDAWKGKPDSRNVVDTDTTYNDGRGIKDTVMISGPLSHAYTKALLLTLKKEPLQDEQEEPETQEPSPHEEPEDEMLRKNTVEKIGMGTESAQQEEETNDFYMMKDFGDHGEDLDFLADKFDFVRPQDLPVNVVCNTTLISMTDFMRPQNLIKFTQDRTNSTIEHVVVVMADALGRTSKKTAKHQFLSIATTRTGFSNTDQEKEFHLAVESHVLPMGYKVIVGLEDYFKYLKNLSKELCI